MSTTSSELCPMVAVVVEISGAKWLVGSRCGLKVRRKSLSHETSKARLAALCAEVEMAREKLAGKESAQVVVAYEAGQEGWWLQRALESRGISAKVIDPASLKVERRRRRAKTDRLDVESLGRALYAWMQGDSSALQMVRPPSVEDEDNREWQRERDRLCAERRACLDRISKKLRTHSIWSWDRKALLAGELRGVDGQPVGPMLQRALEMELDRVDLMEKKLNELEQCAEHLTPTARELISRLVQLRGIGEVGARGLSLKLFWRTFDNRRQVGACTGLTGTPYDSGTMHQDQGISKQGDPLLRALLVELSWFWLRYQPGSAITKWFYERTDGQGKRHKRILIIAVARRLVIALWRYLKFGEMPAGAVFSREVKAADP